jgi:hypothetical protein
MGARKPQDPPIEAFTIVVVEWEDAYSSAAASYSSPQEALDSHFPLIRRSVGFYLGESKGSVILGTDDDRTGPTDGSCGGRMGIPKSLVSKITKVGSIKLKAVK